MHYLSSTLRMSDRGEVRPHVLALPFPEHGHINPMLRLCGHLASRGVAITFVNTEEAQDQVSGLHRWTSQLSSFKFATIPGGFHEDVQGGQSSNAFTITQVLMSGIERQRDVLREMVVESRSSDLPVTCFLVDVMFMDWAGSFADELRIREAIFLPGCGWFFSFATGGYSLPDASVNDNNDVNQTIVAGGLQFDARELEKSLPAMVRNPDIQKKFKGGFRNLDKETLVIINTFEQLEEPSLKAAISQAHVCCVGPIMPINVNHNEEENECINWLDKHDKHSVLYISFGSIACLNSNQLEEVALGLQQSKQPFLWVMRSNIDQLPDEFLENTRDQGILVKWAPQLKVLGHPSIGGFFTHCGWNSIIESIYMGVPLLCIPFFADQHINSLLVTKFWNLGILIDKEKTNGITRDSICNFIDQLMNSMELRQRASLLKMYAREAINLGGSSDISMERFINVMKQKL